MNESDTNLNDPSMNPPADMSDKGWHIALPEIPPKETYWPFVFASGIVLVLWGLISTWMISALGVLLLVLATGGWIGEIRREHSEVQEITHG